MREQCRRVPTYSTAIRRPHHIVVLELKVRVEHGGIELHLPIEFIADLFPVGCWLRHGYRDIMARSHVERGAWIQAWG